MNCTASDVITTEDASLTCMSVLPQLPLSMDMQRAAVAHQWDMREEHELAWSQPPLQVAHHLGILLPGDEQER